MVILVTGVLGASVLLQFLAAMLALRAIPYSGHYRYPWIALSLALVLMVERRVEPLLHLSDGVAHLADALYALVISALFAFGLIGLDRLLGAIRANDEELARVAITDALTGLANRRHLFAELEKELHRANRSGRPLSILMMDLDNFKAVNDRYGHAIGDAVLVTMAAQCRTRLRSTDICGRIGGEEFVVVLPDTDAEGAMRMAERLRSDVCEMPKPDTGSGMVNLTVSIGVATHRPRSLPADVAADSNIGSQVQDFLHRADVALYKAKSSGRNCVQRDAT